MQHGFRANLSCETQLVLTFHDWTTIVNQHGQVDAVLLDFSKAFDKAQYGISGKPLAWIAAFLQNRTQYTVVNGTHSTTTLVTSGVPKGSVLGPTLFMFFIYDISSATSSQLRPFPDDTVL